MVGIDIMHIHRFARFKNEDFLAWRRVFTEQEWQYCFSKAAPARHLAGVFAAKEAVMKALGGAFLRRYDFIEIEHGGDGKPRVRLLNGDDTSVEMSTSHDGELAVSVAFVPPHT